MATRDQIPDILCQEQPLTTGCGSSWFISLWWFILQSLVWIQLHHLHTSVYLSKNWFLDIHIPLLIDLSLYKSFCAVQPWSEGTASQKIGSAVELKGNNWRDIQAQKLERTEDTNKGKVEEHLSTSSLAHREAASGGKPWEYIISKFILLIQKNECIWVL